jgi:hypothetical protein
MPRQVNYRRQQHERTYRKAARYSEENGGSSNSGSTAASGTSGTIDAALDSLDTRVTTLEDAPGGGASELDDLTDVDLTSTAPSDGDVLVFDDVSSTWLPETPSATAGVDSFNTRTGAVTAATSDYDADQVDYDNASSGLTATDVQAAIDEVVASGDSGGGKVAQVVSTQTGAVATGTTVIPLDDTIPQNDEGDEYMTLAITPTDVNSILLIDVVVWIATGTASRHVIAALFQDTTADALAVISGFHNNANEGGGLNFRHKMTAGTTSATTFKVRAGLNSSATATFNGVAGSRFFGGVLASSITITEILP